MSEKAKRTPEEMIPDPRTTKALAATGVTIMGVGITGILYFGAERIANVLNNDYRVDNLPLAVEVSGVVMVVGYTILNRYFERRDTAKVMEDINNGTTVFEAS